MKTQFSIFNGYESIDLKEPFDYWSDFLNEILSNFKFQTEAQTIYFHCCVIFEQENIKQNNFVSDFFQKLPFFTIDNDNKTLHFWWQTPELKSLLVDETKNLNTDKIALSLLNSTFEILSIQNSDENNFLKFDKLEDFIKIAKKEIMENGIFNIRERFKIKQQKEFKNKYWL